MRTLWQVVALVVVGLGLSLAIVGCSKSATSGPDKMEHGKMNSSKTQDGKMDSKMEGGKEGGKMDSKMEGGKEGGKMEGGKMENK